MENLKECGYIIKNDVLYSIDGNISEWEKNFIKKYFNYEVKKQEVLKDFKFYMKPTLINKIVNKNIDFETLENKPFDISWNIEKNILIINDKNFKVIDDDEYTYKIQKSQIKAKNGIKGFIKFLIEASDFESPFNNNIYMILCKIYQNVKACKSI